MMQLPRVRDGLTIQSISPTECVVKRHDSREYFSIGPQEACLLQLLDGRNSVSDVQSAFEKQFQENLSEADLQQFIEAIQPMGLLQSPASEQQSGKQRTQSSPVTGKRRKLLSLNDQSPLFFRVPLCDPDVFLGRLVRRIPFVWTRTFLSVAACFMLAALAVMISSSHQLAMGIPESPGWGDAILFIVVMLVCTSFHEMAHGATLKNFGGEVHETGFLFMFFTPCMYCNVSDAWLIPDKWKRLAVTAAGAFAICVSGLQQCLSGG